MALTKYNYNSFDVTPVASKALAFNSGANGLTTAAEGNMVLIKTVTASSSATISFVDGTSDVVLDNTYPIYVFKFINLHPSSNTCEVHFNGSTDAGSNYNTTKISTYFRAVHSESDGTALVTYDANYDLAQSTAFEPLNVGDFGNDNDQCLSGEMWLFNPSSSVFVKHYFSRVNYTQNTDGSIDNYKAGYMNTTSAVDAIQFKQSSGNIDAGDICLYGIK